MCPPSFFDINYSINDWMKGEKTNIKTALRQWEQLVDTFVDMGVNVHTIPPEPGLPDMVFTANAGVAFDNKFIVSNMKHAERKGEELLFLEWFQRRGYDVISLDKNYDFEGCGDVILHNGTMLAGYGFRSAPEAHIIAAKVINHDLVPLRLVDSRFYHLDTCFCIVDEETAIYYPGAFAPGEIEKIDFMEMIPVSEEDACKFVCNSFLVDKTLVTPAKSTSIGTTLEKMGVSMRHVNVSEFMKSGGAIQCLSFRI